MGLLWGGYTLVLWGYTLLKGYKIGLGELVVPGKYKGKWPPEGYAPANEGGGGTDQYVGPNQHPGDAPWTYKPKPQPEV